MKKENKNVVVVSCPPCGERACPRRFLSGGALATKRGAYKAISLMSPSIGPADHFLRKGGRLGFTLIELLVVVLIIGILAAVAVPQYKKAVEKTHAMQAFSLLKTIAHANKIYRETTGGFPSSFNKLDITLPADFKPATATQDVVIATPPAQTYANSEWELQLENGSGHQRFWIVRLKGEYAGSGFVLYDPKTEEIECFGKGAFSLQQKWPFCEKLFNCSKQTGRYTKWVKFSLEKF